MQRKTELGKKTMKKRRGNAVVWGLFILGISIILGTLLYSKVAPKLTAMKDSTFSAAANATIDGVSTDFYAGVDLLRIALIVVPIVAVIAYVMLIRGRGSS